MFQIQDKFFMITVTNLRFAVLLTMIGFFAAKPEEVKAGNRFSVKKKHLFNQF